MIEMGMDEYDDDDGQELELEELNDNSIVTIDKHQGQLYSIAKCKLEMKI